MGSGGGNPKSLPNDPQRQGNIWHRYEQLENATRSLSNVNQQLIDERAQHKKVSQQDHLEQLLSQDAKLSRCPAESGERPLQPCRACKSSALSSMTACNLSL